MSDPRQRHRNTQERRPWFSIENAAGDSATVRIYDEIGIWGVTAKDFAQQLDSLVVSQIDLHVNSPGGDVFDGIAILNALRSHPARVVATVDGVAASAASFITAGADEVVMARNSELMIHDAWGLAMGNAADMRDLADRLDKVSDNIASIYAEKTGGTVEQWRDHMRNEVWYSAQEAVDAGLADRVEAAPEEDVERAKARFDFSIFNYAGRRNAPTPHAPAATASGFTHKERSTPVAFTDEHLAALRTKLGLAADADGDKIVALVNQVMDDYVKDPDPLPAGAVAVDKGVLDELRAAADLGRQAHEQQQIEKRERIVASAVQEGRIAPARREHWLNALAADFEGAKAALDSLAPGLIPVEPLGHAEPGDHDTFDDAEFQALAVALNLPKGA